MNEGRSLRLVAPLSESKALARAIRSARGNGPILGFVLITKHHAETRASWSWANSAEMEGVIHRLLVQLHTE